ncbi:hypothetical protein F4780DRAFT_762524 [Xylariomycetidae sp. FL0641]|nr:hypothetical protein F4780DRAFT_762524 [Xylariomycetidae sp. FL0641]
MERGVEPAEDGLVRGLELDAHAQEADVAGLAGGGGGRGEVDRGRGPPEPPRDPGRFLGGRREVAVVAAAVVLGIPDGVQHARARHPRVQVVFVAVRESGVVLQRLQLRQPLPVPGLALRVVVAVLRGERGALEPVLLHFPVCRPVLVVPRAALASLVVGSAVAGGLRALLLFSQDFPDPLELLLVCVLGGLAGYRGREPLDAAGEWCLVHDAGFWFCCLLVLVVLKRDCMCGMKRILCSSCVGDDIG